MTSITYIKSSLNHSSALTTPEVALSQFGLWNSIKRAFKKFAKPLAAIVGIAASIAVPFIAPAVAGMIFGGTALGAGAIGAAIAGAGMGAAAGALTAYGTGQNVLMGAGLGLLGGGIGGGLSGFSQTGTLLGNTADAVYGTGMAASAISGPGAAAGTAAATAAGTPGAAAPGAAAPGAAAAAPASTGLGSRLLEASLKAAPGAIGTLVSSLAPSDVGAAAKELQAEMERLQNSDINAYNQAKLLYDQLYARYQQIDPVAAAQLAEASVQAKTAGLISGVNVARGAASAGYAEDAEKRRLAVQGSQEATGAYTDAYYRGEGEKTAALAGLSGAIPRYSSSSGNYLSNRLAAAENKQAGLASDVSSFLTPYALALAPKDTTLTSGEADRLRKENESYRKLFDNNYASP